MGDKVLTNCLEHLSEISNGQAYEPVPCPDLDPLTSSEVEGLQQMISTGKALSYDAISDVWIKNSLKRGFFSDLWNQHTLNFINLSFRARLIPLNKEYPNIPKFDQFRPIMVLSPLYKFMELRFAPILNRYMLEKMNKSQFGFVKGYGTACNLLMLINRIKEAKKADKLDCIFIDFKSAYNTLIREKLYDILIEKHILSVNETLFLKAMHSRVYLESGQKKYWFKDGVP